MNTERNAAILAGFDRGESYGVIARDLGLSRSTVAGVLDRSGCRRAKPTARLPTPAWGERSGAAKLTEAAVLEMRARRAAGAKTREIAEAYGISQHTAWAVCTRLTWAHVL